MPYVERPELPDSVPKFPQPSSSDRPSSPRSPRPEGLGNVDASVPLRPPGTVLPGTRDAAPIVQGTCDASLYGTSSCAVEPRPAEVSFLSGTPAVDANASENDCRPLSAQAPCARHGAPYAPNAVDTVQSGTNFCPVQSGGRDMPSQPSSPRDPRLAAALPDASASAPAPPPFFNTLDVSKGFEQSPLENNHSATFPPHCPPAAATNFPLSRARPSRQDVDVSGPVLAPSTAPPSRRSLDAAFSSAVHPRGSGPSERPPRHASTYEDDGMMQGMRDELDDLHRDLALSEAKRQDLVYENASLSDQLHVTKQSIGAATGAPRLGRAGHPLSGSVRPRAGSELGGCGRSFEESRVRRRTSAAAKATGPYPRRPTSPPPSRHPSGPPRSTSPPLFPPPGPGGGGDSDSEDDPPPGKGTLALVPRSRHPPDSPPPHPPNGALSASFLSRILEDCPAWHCDVFSKSGDPVTNPLSSWHCSTRRAPRTPAAAKLRHAQSPGLDRLVNIFILLDKNPGMVRSSYPRIVQCLTDQYVAFYFLSDADADSNTLNSEALRFFSDACSAASCPTKVTTCFLECCSSYPSSPGAVKSDSPSYPEYLLRYSLSSIILELSPAFSAMLEITFNGSTKLVAGENIFSYLERVREACAAGNIPPGTVRSRLFSVIQEAFSNPLANRATLNEISNRLSQMMATSESLASFQSSLGAVAGIGGVLNDPLILPSSTPALPLVPPAGGFLTTAPAPAGAHVPASPAAGPAFYSPPSPVAAAPLPSPPPGAILYTAPGTPGFVRDGRAPRTCWDLDVILPLLDPNYPLPEFRGARTCYFCEVIKGKTLIPWTPDTPRPSIESKQKFGHDPWHCPEVGRELKRLRAAGDTRFSEALCNGVMGKPETRDGFPRERS